VIKVIPQENKQPGTNMPKKGKRKPESSLMEKECDYKTRARKRTHKRLYHGLLSRKASHFQKVLAYPDDFNTDYYTENYADTEEEEHQYGDIAGITVFSQHGLNPPQEN
jgi:hypothetical protein